VTGFSVGSAAAAALAVPAANALHGWRGTFVSFGIFAALLVVVWSLMTRSHPRHERPTLPRAHLPLRSKVAWWLLAIAALNASIFYGLASWLPASYVERGWSQDRAGLLLTVMILASLPVSLLVPWAADRVGSRRTYLVGSASVMVVGMLGILFAPGGAWIWACAIGAANVIALVVTLTLPLDATDRSDEVAAVIGFMLGGGYVCSALAPFGLGAARDLTGNFHTALWLITVGAAAMVVLTAPMSPERLRRSLAGMHGRGAPETETAAKPASP
jgi:CP family cyanate transporter-like MFS transporter